MRTIAFLLAALLLISSGALAEGDPRKVENAAPTTPTGRVDCITDGYMCDMNLINFAIPDNDPSGVTMIPIVTDPGYIIQDVILNVNIQHTWVGDLIMTVSYSLECDDHLDGLGSVLCRHGLAGCPFDGCCGCSGDLEGWYGFDDTAPSIEDACEASFPAACYGPDYDSYGLDGFDGLPTGGCFVLHVSDCAAGDVGTVYAWEICVLGEPIPPAQGALDIKPESCPNPFNVKAQGMLPVAAVSTEAFDATFIDVATLSLECPDGSAEPIWHGYGDVATPVGPDADPCECTDEGPDGMTDLKLKFLRQDIVAVLGDVEDGEEIELTLTGQMMDGTPFEVSDCVQILDRGKGIASRATGELGDPAARSSEASTWGTIKAFYR